MRNRRPRSLRWLWISLLVLFLLGVAAVLGFSAWVNVFLRSSEFRDLVAVRTGDALQADAEYSEFRWTGSTIFTEKLNLVGRDSSPIKSLNAQQIRADVNWRALFDGAWRIEDINVMKADAIFRPPGPVPVGQRETPTSQDVPSFLPQRFEVGRLKVDNATIAFGEGMEQSGILKGSTIEMKPDGSGWLIGGTGGEVSRTGIPSSKVTSFRARMQKEAFFLTDARLIMGDSGKIAVSGSAEPAGSRFAIEYEQVDVVPFLNPKWKKRLSGMVAGKTSLTLLQGKPATAQGKVTLTEGRLENIPLFDQVAQFTGSPQFKRMSLQEMSGNFSWDGSNLLITDFLTESKGLVRVEGDCQIGKGGAVAGLFRVGVTPQTLQWLPGSQDHVFTESRDGYLWTNMKVSGTLDNLTEDLTSRLATAVGQKVIEQGINILNAPPEATKEAIKGALDILLPNVAP